MYVWSAQVGERTAGYFELRRHPDRTVEVMYFGLAPEFIGRGIGGWLLTRTAEEAFALDASRVMLNTCTLDAPQALPNYLARGFTIVREDQYLLDVPEHGVQRQDGLQRLTLRNAAGQRRNLSPKSSLVCLMNQHLERHVSKYMRLGPCEQECGYSLSLPPS